jgi:Fungal specific transcription factor domain
MSSSSPQIQGFISQAIEVSSHSLLDEISVSDQTSGAVSPAGRIDNDSLIDSYYKNFHKFHPFLPPQKHMIKLCQDPNKQLTFKPLIATMRLVGHIYQTQEWSIPLKDHAEACFLQAPLTDPVMVQCRLLYSIALFWQEHKDEAQLQVSAASRLALDLEMFSQEFAAKHGAEDLVLRETWRRTWWMLYIVDAYYAGTLGTMNFEVVNIESTVDLPCEEWEFESGVSVDIVACFNEVWFGKLT